jgi:energy-coupling factor transport system permease protein
VGVVWVFHTDAHTTRVFRGFCYFAGLAVFIRLAFAALIGNSFATDVLFTLPELATPSWLGGLSLGGEVTATALNNALLEGLRMATIVLAIGAASALTSPVRVLSQLPSAVYEVGLTVLIALNTVPALAQDVARTQTALRLRGRKAAGLRALTSALAPTMDSSLRRSLAMASFMESRGYGRLLSQTSQLQRSAHSIATVSILVFLLLTISALMSVSFQKTFGHVALAGLALSVVALVITSMGLKSRSHYRPIRWGQQDSACLVVAVAITATIWATS